MNAEPRAIKTPAEQALTAAYAAARAKLPGKGAIADLREAAFQRFDAVGLPHRRIEEWKYTDLRALMREAKPLAEPAKAKGKVPELPGLTADRIAIIAPQSGQVTAWLDLTGLRPPETLAAAKADLVMAQQAAAEAAAKLPVPKDAPLKKPGEYRLLGKRTPRFDGPAIVTGKAIFGLDVRRPGQRFAAVLVGPCECAREWEDARRARMRLHLQGVVSPDLVALSRSFWARAS